MTKDKQPIPQILENSYDEAKGCYSLIVEGVPSDIWDRYDCYRNGDFARHSEYLRPPVINGVQATNATAITPIPTEYNGRKCTKIDIWAVSNAIDEAIVASYHKGEGDKAMSRRSGRIKDEAEKIKQANPTIYHDYCKTILDHAQHALTFLIMGVAGISTII